MEKHHRLCKCLGCMTPKQFHTPEPEQERMEKHKFVKSDLVDWCGHGATFDAQGRIDETNACCESESDPIHTPEQEGNREGADPYLEQAIKDVARDWNQDEESTRYWANHPVLDTREKWAVRQRATILKQEQDIICEENGDTW